MSAVARLQAWYQRQCNDAWEHTNGIAVGTLDNPGWTLTVDLTGTALENVGFTEVAENVGPHNHPIGTDWLVCSVENHQWRGAGGPHKLEKLIERFVSWAEQHGS